MHKKIIGPTTLKILLAGLKDPYHKMRIQAIDILDLSKPEILKSALPTTGKKWRKLIQKTVQAKVIGALATLGEKYLPNFENGLKSFSSVQGNSAYGIAKISPEKTKELLNDIDLEKCKRRFGNVTHHDVEINAKTYVCTCPSGCDIYPSSLSKT